MWAYARGAARADGILIFLGTFLEETGALFTGTHIHSYEFWRYVFEFRRHIFKFEVWPNI